MANRAGWLAMASTKAAQGREAIRWQASSYRFVDVPDPGSECAHLTDLQRLGTFTNAVDQWRTELVEADLETIPRLSLDAIGKRQRGSAEVVHMDVTRAQKLRVLEVVEFKVGQTVAHVVFAAEKFLFPDRFTIALDAAGADQMLGQFTDA
ncbi:hypothetical protein D3C86_1559070 [compost metagenome]